MRFVVAISISLSLIILPSNLILGSLSGQSENGVKKKVLWTDVKDFISSATSENIAAVVKQASSSNNNQEEYSAIILALDTPGGSLDATLDILASMQKSSIPIIHRNIIEAIAENPQDLLMKAHNATVITQQGIKVLNLSDAEIVKHEPSLRVMLVDFLSNPLIATTFLIIGFFALIFGFTSPGFGVEIAGAILIILSLVGQGFDINWAAFALLAIGAGLIGYELYSPSFGALGNGGIAVIVIGIGLMITQPVRPLLIKEEHLGNLAVLSSIIILPFAVLMGYITYKVWQSKRKKKVAFVLQSNEGTTLDIISNKKYGFVLVGGEYWKAKSNKSDIKRGERIRVVDKQGPFLIVESLDREKVS